MVHAQPRMTRITCFCFNGLTPTVLFNIHLSLCTHVRALVNKNNNKHILPPALHVTCTCTCTCIYTMYDMFDTVCTCNLILMMYMYMGTMYGAQFHN